MTSRSDDRRAAQAAKDAPCGVDDPKMTPKPRFLPGFLVPLPRIYSELFNTRAHTRRHAHIEGNKRNAEFLGFWGESEKKRRMRWIEQQIEAAPATHERPRPLEL